MQLNAREIVEWWHEAPLGNTETVTVAVGAARSGMSVADLRGVHFLTYGLKASAACRLEIQGSGIAAFSASELLVSHDVPAATYATPYLLTGGMGANGFVVVTLPFVRIKLIDTSASIHTYTRLYVKAWGG